MPLGPAVQLNPIAVVELAVATGFVGAEGNASVLLAIIADIGETLPSVSTACTAN
jgi:hypothetical protein